MRQNRRRTDATATAPRMPLDSKLPTVGTTIFTVMSQLAAEEGALNLSQGFPDFDGPPRLLDRVVHHLRSGANQYAPMAGVPALRQAIAGKVRDLYGRAVDADREVTVTSGATEALFDAMAAVIRPGDEAIVLDPAYDSYEPGIVLNGGRAVHVPMRADFGVDWQRVEDAVTARTRLLIVNSPHNPSGAVFDAADLDALEHLVARHDLLLLSDEVYEHIVFDGRPHASLLRRDALYARAFVVSSFGKTCHTTGWKIGYCVAPPALTAELRKVHQFVTFTSITPVQLGLADFLVECPQHHLGLGAFYQAKRDRFCAGLAASRLRCVPSAGTYFQLVDYGAISGERDVDLARRLTREVKLASIPVSVFYARPPAATLLRFCFAKDDRTLDAATEILCRL
jgi:methionine aminotransferase